MVHLVLPFSVDCGDISVLTFYVLLYVWCVTLKIVKKKKKKIGFNIKQKKKNILIKSVKTNPLLCFMYCRQTASCPQYGF